MGFDLARFERADIIENFMPELICAICTDVFCKPKRIKACGHVFCEVCLNRSLDESNPKCPVCRRSVKKKKKSRHGLLADDRISSSILDKMKVFCLFKQQGCQATEELAQVETHEKDCSFDPSKEVICPNGCDMKMARNALEQHNCIAALKERIEDRTQQTFDELTETLDTSVQQAVDHLGARMMESLHGENSQLRDSINAHLVEFRTNYDKTVINPLKRKIFELDNLYAESTKRIRQTCLQVADRKRRKLNFKLLGFREETGSEETDRGYQVKLKMAGFTFDLFYVHSTGLIISCLGPSSSEKRDTPASWSCTIAGTLQVYIKSGETTLKEYSLTDATFSPDTRNTMFHCTRHSDSDTPASGAVTLMSVVLPEESLIVDLAPGHRTVPSISIN